MNRRILTLSLLVTTIAGIASAEGDDINENLRQLGTDVAKGYIGPVISAVGSNLNQGWFHQSPRPIKFGVDLEASVAFVGTSFASGSEEFSASTKARINDDLADQIATEMAREAAPGRDADDPVYEAAYESFYDSLVGKSISVRVSGPTIVGADDQNVRYVVSATDSLVGPDGRKYALKNRAANLPVKGLGLTGFLPGVPLVVPQFTVGTFYGTMASLRFASAGDISFWGIGVNHNPGVWREDGNFLPLGINSSVTFAYSRLGFGDYMNFSAWNIGLMASKRIGFRFLNVTPYAGLGMEHSALEVKYTSDILDTKGNPIAVSFEESGENLMRLQLGTGVRLGVFNLVAGYTMAKYSAANVEVALAF